VPRIAWVLLALGIAIASASSASAALVKIDFDFSASTIDILGGTIVVPPDGAVTAASGQIQVQGNSLTSIQSGAAQIRALDMAATISATVLAEAGVSGTLSAGKFAGGLGQLSAGLGVINLSVPLRLTLDATLGCSDLNVTNTLDGCGALGLPVTIQGVRELALTQLAIGNIATSGAATIMTTFAITLSGITAVLTLEGAEVGRTLVPEPNTFSLILSGLGALALVRNEARRRRNLPS
jgi:hypothetical protein